jgi:hypothetical protein
MAASVEHGGSLDAAVTLKPSLMVLLVCAVGAAGDLHALPRISALDGARARVAELRADLDGRRRCATATRRALVTDGDAERLLSDVAATCPAVADPVAP